MIESDGTVSVTQPAPQGLSAYVLLFWALVAAALATWVVEPGQFERVMRAGVTFVVPGSLHAAPSAGQGPGDVILAIVSGMESTASIIFLIMFTGGAVAILEYTGAMQAYLGKLVGAGERSNLWVILGVASVMSVLGTAGIVSNSVVAFVPLGMLLARSLGLPQQFGAALMCIGTLSGFNVAILNPITTGLSQRLAELPVFSGMGLRVAAWLAFLVTALIFLGWHAHRWFKREGGQHASEGPEQWDTVFHHGQDADAPDATCPTLPLPNREQPTLAHPTRAHRSALMFSAGALLVFIYGAMQWHWGEAHMSGTFVVIAIGAGLLCRMRPSQISDEFLAGCSRLVPGALIVGMARAISIVLHDGNILDPIVNTLSGWLAPLQSSMAAIGVFLISGVMHVAISSGSGESAVLVPIVTPLADTLHLTRQVIVQAVLFGEGLINLVNPTSGSLMAVLATAGIPFGKWLQWVWPLFAAWFVICVVSLVTGVLIHWGPF